MYLKVLLKFIAKVNLGPNTTANKIRVWSRN